MFADESQSVNRTDTRSARFNGSSASHGGGSNEADVAKNRPIRVTKRCKQSQLLGWTLRCRRWARFCKRRVIAQDISASGISAPEPFSPLQHGFEIDVPHHPGPGPAGSYVAPWKFKNFKAKTPNEHIEDRMAAEAAAWIQTVKDEPFYMNYWQFSVHAPFDAKQSLIDEYSPKIDPNSPQRCATYAAMVHSLDDAVGTLIKAIEEAGVAERTAFIFYSDNGGNMYNVVDGAPPTSNRPLRGGKATMFEGGIRVPGIVAVARSHETWFDLRHAHQNV